MKQIEIKNLTKSFGENIVLNDVSLTIEKGDIYGVLGLSGAGKSTLVRCINGLEKQTSGSIIFENQEINDKNIRDIRQKVAMIFQSFNLLKQRNVLKNVLISSELSKSKKDKLSQINKAKELLKLVGLEDKMYCYPSQLSGGQQQRVAIARALMSDPEVLLCDEATSALDPETTESILDLLKDLNEKFKLTIIMISHQMTVVKQICNKVAIISNSKIVESGSLEEVFNDPKTDIARKFVYTTNVVSKFNDSKLLKVIFDGDIVQPLITNIIQDCNILVSIVYANSYLIENRVYGQLIFKLPYFEEDIIKLKKYLDSKNVKYVEVSKDELN